MMKIHSLSWDSDFSEELESVFQLRHFGRRHRGFENPEKNLEIYWKL